MRCLHVISGLARHGAEMGLYKLLLSLRGGAVESLVVSLAEGGSLRADIEALGVHVAPLGLARGSAPSPGALRRLRALAREFRPDVAHGWMYHGNHGASAAAVVAGRRAAVIWSIHSSYDPGTEKAATDIVIRAGARFSRHARKIVYVSRVAAEQHEAIGYAADRRVLIPYGFDTERYAPSEAARAEFRAGLGLPADAFVIGHVARVHPQKDHGNLLRAAALLAGRHPEARFALVGRGADAANADLVAQIASAGLGDRVLLLGERSDLARLTAGFDVATLSSAWGEAFPNVIGEAMACGVPVVATDVGDSRFVVGDTGLVVPPRDATALAAAWESMIERGAGGRRALGARARARVVRDFSLAAVAARYEDLYAGVAAGR